MKNKNKLFAKDHNRKLNKKSREDKEKVELERILSNMSRQDFVRKSY